MECGRGPGPPQEEHMNDLSASFQIKRQALLEAGVVMMDPSAV